MQIVKTISELRTMLRAARTNDARVGLVPTMGAFHDGHLALMRESLRQCDVTVVSLFVNPTQFGDPSDLAAYPRDDARDARLAEEIGVDILFAPLVYEMYPAGFDTVINVGGVTQPLEGVARGAAHFRGVATVVTKLFNMVQPDVAFFGQKDVQQTRVIRKLVRDLDLPVEIVVCPTVRESDGLAMSSRNARLSPEARLQAVALHSALEAMRVSFTNGERASRTLLSLGREKLVAQGIRSDDIDYFAVVNSETLENIDRVDDATLITIAAHVGGVRLIDNIILTAQ